MSRKNKNGGRRNYSPKTYSRDFLRPTPIERAIQEANKPASPQAVAVSDRIACDDKCSYEYKRMPAAWLETDFSYQRKIDSARVDRIVNSFDPRLANEVKVSFRDGKFYVFDGAHTLSALKRIHGEDSFMVDCKVYYGLSYEDALAEAQAKGFAEADPTADVDGFDAAAKIAILASIAFNSRVKLNDVYTEGIRNITQLDMDTADDMGYVIKLLALAHRTPEGIDVRVHPTMLPKAHQMAQVNGVFNAIYVTGDAVGETMFFGEGAGAGPAAAAVMGDVLEVARHMTLGIPPVVGCTCTDNLPIVSMEKLSTKYYIRFSVADRSGVLAAMAGVFAKHGVSVRSVVQRGSAQHETVNLSYVTHTASEASVRRVLEEIGGLEDVLRAEPSVIRVED